MKVAQTQPPGSSNHTGGQCIENNGTMDNSVLFSLQLLNKETKIKIVIEFFKEKFP